MKSDRQAACAKLNGISLLHQNQQQHMKVPEFKTSKRFLRSIDLPCLVAKVKNSQLPGVAHRHIHEYHEDPVCKIYLRGKKPKEISPWQEKLLDDLFAKEGLATAVREAMREYEESPKWAGERYVHLAAEDRRKVNKHGIESYIVISTIVIDEVKRTVIISAEAEIDGNLEEHGVSIYLQKGRWRFDYADYFNRYQNSFEPQQLTNEEELAGRSWKDSLQQWNKIFPSPEASALTETNGEVLYGEWSYDIAETTKLMKRLGKSKEEIQKIRDCGHFSEDSIRLSSNTLQFISHGFPTGAFWIHSYERKGNRFRVRIQTMEKGKLVKEAQIFTETYWCDGKILVQEGMDFVYRRNQDSKQAKNR